MDVKKTLKCVSICFFIICSIIKSSHAQNSNLQKIKSITINSNSNDRSIISTINLNFETNEDIGDMANSINTEDSQILIWYNGMNGLLKNKVYINNKFYVKDKTISIDFYKPLPSGPRSIGLRLEGVYKLEFDLDNDSNYETTKTFHILFGDIDGNGIVDQNDLIEIKKLFGNTGFHIGGDLNGDGIVNDLDFAIVLKSIGKSIKTDTENYNIGFSPPAIWTGAVDLNISKPPEIQILKMFIEHRQVTDFFYNKNYKFPSQSTRDASNLEAYVLGYDGLGNQIGKSKSAYISLANRKKTPERNIENFFWRPQFTGKGQPNDESLYPRSNISNKISGRMRMSMNQKNFLASGLNVLIDDKPIKIIDPPSFPNPNIPWYAGHENYFYPWTYEGGDVDTFAYPNGIHSITIKEYDSNYDNPNLFYQQKKYIMDFENGHSPMALVPKQQEYVISVGETIDVSNDMVLEFTDGVNSQSVPVNLAYKRGDPQSVSTSKSEITGTRRGVVELQAFYQNRFYATIRIRVGVDGFPHFGIGGEIRHDYEKDKSIIPRSLFGSYDIFKGNAYIAEYKNAGFNAYETGIFSNPWYWRAAVGSNDLILASYNKEQDKVLDNIIQNSKNSGLHVIATGDEFARYGEYVWAYSYNYLPWAVPSFMHAFQKMHDSKRFIAVEMVDETVMMGSNAPNLDYARIISKGVESPWENNVRNDKSNYMYLNGNPIEPSVVEKLHKSVSNFSVPMGWPLFSLVGGDRAYNWGPFGEDLKPYPAWNKASDYHSWQLTLSSGWIHHPTTGDLLSYLKYLNFGVLDRQLSGVDPNYPLMVDWSSDANNYIKNTSGINQVQGIDESVSDMSPIYDPSMVELQISHLIARGASGLRGYHWSTDDHKAKALNTPIGSIVSDTGADPFFANVRGWKSASIINNLIAEFEPYLLQPYASIVNPKSSQIIAGARQGDVGSIYWTVSFEDNPVSVTLDLSQYSSENGPVEIISLWQGQVTRENINESSLKNLNLNYKPTETKIIVIKNN